MSNQTQRANVKKNGILSWGGIRSSAGQGAFCKINLLTAALADMLLVEFIRKDLNFLPTARAFAHERF
jgi:hypothetical protein